MFTSVVGTLVATSCRQGEFGEPICVNVIQARRHGPICIKSGDTTVEVDGNLAVAWSLRHVSGVKVKGGKQSLWFRSTAVLHRQRDRWKIAHMHESVPFAMDGSGKALLDLTPEGL